MARLRRRSYLVEANLIAGDDGAAAGELNASPEQGERAAFGSPLLSSPYAAAFRDARQPMRPSPAKPSSSIAHVEGSGTAMVVPVRVRPVPIEPSNAKMEPSSTSAPKLPVAPASEAPATRPPGVTKGGGRSLPPLAKSSVDGGRGGVMPYAMW